MLYVRTFILALMDFFLFLRFRLLVRFATTNGTKRLNYGKHDEKTA